jgi:hypothetical protein
VAATTTPLTPCSQLFLVSGLVFAVWDSYSYLYQDYYNVIPVPWPVANEFDCMSQCKENCMFWTYIIPNTSYIIPNTSYNIPIFSCWTYYEWQIPSNWNGTNPWHPDSSAISGFIWGTVEDYCSTCGRNAQGCDS